MPRITPCLALPPFAGNPERLPAWPTQSVCEILNSSGTQTPVTRLVMRVKLCNADQSQQGANQLLKGGGRMRLRCMTGLEIGPEAP